MSILKFASCFALEESGPQEHLFSSISPARSGWIAPGRIGFMSTQRRENRSTPATGACRRGPRYRSRPTGCMERAEDFGKKSQTPNSRLNHASTSGGMALAKLATNSLLSDYRNTPLVRLVPMDIRRGSPPPGADRRAQKPIRVRLTGLPAIPSPSGLARLRPSLPRVPAASSCRTERYDGKRDLYLQHAA
jgi:hypothetical protein